MNSSPRHPLFAPLRRLILAGFSVALLTAAAFAQGAATGTIEGRVFDAGRGEYLERARLVIEGTSQETFTEAGGPYDATVAKRLHDEVLATGNTRDPADAYRAFRGHDPGIAALMRKRGFPVPAGAH